MMMTMKKMNKRSLNSFFFIEKYFRLTKRLCYDIINYKNKGGKMNINFGNETNIKIKHLPNDVLIAEIGNETTFEQVILIYNYLKEFDFDFNIVSFENNESDYRKIVSDFAYSSNQKLLSVRSKISFLVEEIVKLKEISLKDQIEVGYVDVNNEMQIRINGTNASVTSLSINVNIEMLKERFSEIENFFDEFHYFDK